MMELPNSLAAIMMLMPVPKTMHSTLLGVIFEMMQEGAITAKAVATPSGGYIDRNRIHCRLGVRFSTTRLTKSKNSSVKI